MEHSNWRDCQAWRNSSLPMNTTSNEAAKLFDVNLSQLVAYRENDQFGGFLSSLNQMVQADPSFVMGHCLKMAAELLGTSSALSTHLKQTNESVQRLVELKTSLESELSDRELLHVKAAEMLARGDLDCAANYWEKILIQSIKNLIKFIHP